MTINWGDLVADAELTEQVSAISELEFERGQIEPTWFSIDGISVFPVMARDGSGGVFVITPSSPRVLYCTSEGAAGVIAHDLDGLMTLVVMCPYWYDVLHYSGMGKLHEMRRAAAILEAAWLEDDEDHATTRELLLAKLGLSAPRDLIGTLHELISGSDVKVIAPGGQPAESLFGRFTIDDNPFI
jgi:hypothetical protein